MPGSAVAEFQILAFITSALAILFSSKLLYRQLHAIAGALGVPPFLVASLLVALSTSLPELFIGTTAAFRGEPGFALGNVFGANIIGLTLIAGFVLLLGRSRIRLSDHIKRGRLVLTFGISSVPVLMLFDGALSRLDGVILLVLYGLYIFYSFTTREPRDAIARSVNTPSLGKNLLYFVLAVVVLVGASQVLFSTTQSVGFALGISPFIMGMFALSFGTTLPEISFGFRSAFDRRPELSLADVVGSAAVNACGILGLVAIIAPIAPDNLLVTLIDGLFYVALVLFFYLLLWERETTRIRGSVLIGTYALFVVLNILLH